MLASCCVLLLARGDHRGVSSLSRMILTNSDVCEADTMRFRIKAFSDLLCRRPVAITSSIKRGFSQRAVDFLALSEGLFVAVELICRLQVVLPLQVNSLLFIAKVLPESIIELGLELLGLLFDQLVEIAALWRASLDKTDFCRGNAVRRIHLSRQTLFQLNHVLVVQLSLLLHLLQRCVEKLVTVQVIWRAVVQRVVQLTLVVGAENLSLVRSRVSLAVMREEVLITCHEPFEAPRLGSQALLLVACAPLLHVDDVANLTRVVACTPARGVRRPSKRVDAILVLLVR